jgi:hypothetical protein
MYLNAYLVEKMVEARLADLRAERARLARRAAARSGPGGIAPRLGAGLVRLGRWLGDGGSVAPPNGGVRVGSLR